MTVRCRGGRDKVVGWGGVQMPSAHRRLHRLDAPACVGRSGGLLSQHTLGPPFINDRPFMISASTYVVRHSEGRLKVLLNTSTVRLVEQHGTRC